MKELLKATKGDGKTIVEVETTTAITTTTATTVAIIVITIATISIIKEGKARGVATGVNALPIRACYECRDRNHDQSRCPNLADRRGGNVAGQAYSLRDAEQGHGPNVVTGTFLLNNRYARVLFDSGSDKSFINSGFSHLIDIKPVRLNISYEVELADGKLVSTNTVLRGCNLNLLNQLFEVDLMPIELGAFDVIIGMDCNTPRILIPLRPILGVLQIGIRAKVIENQITAGPEEPEQAPPSPIYVPFVPEPVYPEFLPEDDVLPAEEQPLPVAASPTTESPGYIPESDPEEDPEEDDEEDPEEDPADYPEEHLAPADPAAVAYSADQDPYLAYRVTARCPIDRQAPHRSSPWKLLKIVSPPRTHQPSPLSPYSSPLPQIPSPPLPIPSPPPNSPTYVEGSSDPDLLGLDEKMQLPSTCS
ncbi:putative reverse transcriptase domain-containing protein [Tanacetum coccineum]